MSNEATMYPETKPVKLTKKALNDFIKWSTTKYNDWSGYGTKKEAVEKVFKALSDKDAFEIFYVECASPQGENYYSSGGPRYWKTKQGGEKYMVDPVMRIITAEHSKRIIEFIKP